MPRGQGADAEQVNVVLDCLADGLFGRLEQRTYVDVEAQVGEAGGDHLRPAVVPVLPEFGDQDPGAAAVGLHEAIGQCAYGL